MHKKTTIKQINLCSEVLLEPEIIKDIEKIAKNKKRDFNSLIDAVSQMNENSIDWWVSPVATRNTYQSNLFFEYCELIYISELINKIDGKAVITVDNYIMYEYIKKMKKDKSDIIVIFKNKLKYKIRRIELFFKNIIKTFVKCGSQLLAAKIFCRKIKIKKPITVIGTFIYTNSFESGSYQDRHFPNIENDLTPEEISEIYYFPTAYGVKNFITLYKLVGKKMDRIIIKENYLRFKDYLEAFGVYFRIGKLKINKRLLINNIDFSDLINSHIGVHNIPTNMVDSLLRFTSIKRMKENNIEIKRFVDWFENQDINRANVLGMRLNYANAVLIGYIGFVPTNHYLCMQPTQIELAAKVIPDTINVIGTGYFEMLNEFAPNLNLTTSPALRYKKMWEENKLRIKSEDLRILVILPVIQREATELIQSLRKYLPSLKALSYKSVKLTFKQHPAVLNKNKFSRISERNNNIVEEWSAQNLTELLERTDVMIAAASSAIFESIVHGVPVIIIGNRRGLTYNPIPTNCKSKKWVIYYGEKPLSSIIMDLLVDDKNNMRSLELELNELKIRYFQMITSSETRRLVVG